LRRFSGDGQYIVSGIGKLQSQLITNSSGSSRDDDVFHKAKISKIFKKNRFKNSDSSNIKYKITFIFHNFEQELILS
jgi:hypothetical protein